MNNTNYGRWSINRLKGYIRRKYDHGGYGRALRVLARRISIMELRNFIYTLGEE
jgi:hypothetical protein